MKPWTKDLTIDFNIGRNVYTAEVTALCCEEYYGNRKFPYIDDYRINEITNGGGKKVETITDAMKFEVDRIFTEEYIDLDIEDEARFDMCEDDD